MAYCIDPQFSWSSHKNSRGRMGIFGGYRADRLIAEVRESGDPASAKAKSALAKLQGLGSERDQADRGRACDRRQARDDRVRRGADAADRQQDLPADRQGARGGEPARGRRRRLGARLLAQLLAEPAARSPAAARRVEARGPRHHRVAEGPLPAARPAECRLPAGPEREGGAVPHRGRAGGRELGGRAGRTRRGQGHRSRARTSSRCSPASTRPRCARRCRRR